MARSERTLKREAMASPRARPPFRARGRRWHRQLKWTLPLALLAGLVPVAQRSSVLPAPELGAVRESSATRGAPAPLPAREARRASALAPPRELPVAATLQAENAPAPAPDENAGRSRISGSVLDASGGSIVGARLSASDPRGALLAAATSDGSGQFRLELAPGLARISARAEGYSQQVQLIEAPLDGLRLVLAPESSIAGRVVAEGTGRPVAGALVSAVNEDGPSSEPRAARTTEDGEFRVSGLSAGRHSLAAVAEHWRAAPQQITLGVAESIEPVELRVAAAMPIRGLVRVGGSPCARGSVFIHGELNLYADLAPDGSVVFDGVPPGRYSLDVSCVGALAQSETIELEGAPATRVWELERGLELRGVARSADDTPLAGATIEVLAAGERGERADTSCRSDERGEFSCSGLSPGEYDCAIGPGAPPRSDSVRVALGREAAPPLVLRAHAEGALRVRLEGSEGFEMRTLSVVARSEKQLLVGELRGSEFVFDPIALGVYELALDPAAPGSGRRVELTQPGEVRELTLPVPAPRAIAGRVVDETGQGVPDAWVRVVGTSAFLLFRPATPVLTDGDGGFVVPGLLPERYQLSASSGQRTAELEVPSDSQGLIVTLHDVGAGSKAPQLRSSLR